MKQVLYVISIFVMPLLIAAKCEKDAPACSQNCVTVQFRGRAFQKLTTAPISNFPITVKWQRKGLQHIGTNRYTIASVATSQDGTFNITAILDTVNFRDFRIDVFAGSNGSYLITNPSNLDDKRSFYDVDPAEMRNLEFVYYPKTIVSVRMHRTMTDAFAALTIGTKFEGYPSKNVERGPSKITRDTTIQFYTSTDVYTYIYVSKLNNNLPSVTTIDSMICRKDQDNVITINY